MEKTTITQAEWEVMRVVQANHQATSREIINTLQAILDWKEGTIKSLINRLIQKDYLRPSTNTRPILYEATITCEKALQGELSTLLERSCTLDRHRYIQYLIQSEELSQRDCQLLIDTLKEKMATAPTTIKCRCKKGQCTCHHH